MIWVFRSQFQNFEISKSNTHQKETSRKWWFLTGWRSALPEELMFFDHSFREGSNSFNIVWCFLTIVWRIVFGSFAPIRFHRETRFLSLLSVNYVTGLKFAKPKNFVNVTSADDVRLFTAARPEVGKKIAGADIFFVSRRAPAHAVLHPSQSQYMCLGNQVMYMCLGSQVMYVCLGNQVMCRW